MCCESTTSETAPPTKMTSGRSAVMSLAYSTASSATLSFTATTEQLHLRAERRYDLHVASSAKRPKYDASDDDDSFCVSVCDILAGVPGVQSVAAAQQHEEEPVSEPTTAEELPAYTRLEDIERCNPPRAPLCDFSKVAPGAACGVAGGKALSRLIAQRVSDTLSPAFFLKLMQNVTCGASRQEASLFSGSDMYYDLQEILLDVVLSLPAVQE